MRRRAVSALAVAAVLTLSVTAGGRSQEQPLVDAEIHQGASQRGVVRVLVQLAAPYVPEVQLPSRAHVIAQRQSISTVQQLVRGNLAGVSHRVVRDFRGAVPAMAIEVGPDGLRVLETLRGVVTHVVEDRPRHPLLVESVPRIQASQAVALGYDGRGTTLVFMDSGVDKDHPFFEDESGTPRIVAEACFSSNFAAQSATSLCPGASPADGGTSSTAVGSGAACDSSTISGCDHGTLVAGIAAGRGDSFIGVAPGADLVSIQVFSKIDDEDFCGGPEVTPCVGSFPSDQIAAAQYVLDTLLPSVPNIAAINLSLGSGRFAIPCNSSFPLEGQLIADLRAAGVAMVAASGNEGRIGSVTAPACLDAVVSVGATTDPPGEALASFSNRAPGLTLLAPGVTIETSAPGGGFEPFNGTSAAAPHVAGVFAIFRQAVPSATVSQVVTALQSTGQAIGGFKRVKVFDALATFPGVLPTVQFASATYSASEGDTTRAATFAVTRTGPPALIAGTSATVLVSTRNGTAVAGTSGATDYAPITNQVVSLAPGETTKNVVITLRGDFTVEPDETVHLTLTSPTGALLGGQPTAVFTILNDDQPGTIAFAQPTYTVDEGVGAAALTLTRAGGLGTGATARVSTIAAGSTATAGADYTALVNKVVTFAGGATTATFTLPIVNDTLAEAGETVQLQITGVGVGAAIGAPSTATVVITDNDVPGTVQFAQATYQVAEGTATAPITLTRSGGAASGVTIQYRVTPGSAGTATGDGVDYTLNTGTVTFGANETSRTFNVAIVNDTLIEPAQTVGLQLFNPSVGLTIGAQSTATLTIQDNDAPTFRFGAAAYTVAEGATGKVTVVRTNGVGTAVTVDYQIQGASTATASGGGQDYTLTNGTVSFGEGVTSQMITIPTVQDTRFEGNETIVLRLTNPSTGAVVAPDTTTVTIADNDTPGTIQFSAAAYKISENAGPATVRVTRTGANLAEGVTVQLTTTNGTATAADYTSASQVLTFAALEAFKDIPIAITDDPLAEGDETVTLSLSNPTGGARLGATRAARLTILDDEQSLQFSAPGYIVSEAATSATVTVVRVGPPVGTVTVNYASAVGTATPGADFTGVDGTLTFGPGIASRTFTVPLLTDTVFEPSESINLLLTNPGGGAQLGPVSAATITVTDNDPPGTIRFSAAGYTVSEAGTATITVVRTPGTASAVTVNYATVAGGTAVAGTDYLTAGGTLTFNAGQASTSFTVALLNNNFDEPNKTVNLQLSSPTGGATLGPPSTAVLTIKDDDVPGLISFSGPVYTVPERAGLATIRVTRSGTAEGVTVDFETANGSAAALDYQAVSRTTLTFAAGETSKTIPIEIMEDAAREGNETVRLILSNPTGGAMLGAYGQATLTIVDNETGGTVQFSAAAYAVAENAAGGVASVTITRTGSTTPGQTVRVSASPGTAVAGTDFGAFANQLVTFTGTQPSVTVPITIINNAGIVGSRTVDLVLSSPTGGLSLGVPRTAVLTILEDDATIQFANASYTVTEGGVATLTVTRTGGTIGTATVAYATSSTPGQATTGVDYPIRTGTLTFGPGVTSRTLTVATTNDVLVEGPESLTVVLSNPDPAQSISLGSPSTATLAITDNDAAGSLRFSTAAYAVTEGGSATLTVSRTGGSAGTVTVQYATSDGGGGGVAASGNGVDYTTRTGVLTFLNGVTSQTLPVPTTADPLLEGPETFTVTLSDVTGGAVLGAPSVAVVTIVDDETPRIQFAAAAYKVAESTAAITLTVLRVGPATAQSSVQYALAGVTATGDGVDFDSKGGVLTFAPGMTSRTIVVPIVNDTTKESAETFTATLSNPTGGAILGATPVATVTITDNDPAGVVQFSQSSYAAVEGRPAAITVTRTGTAGPVTVDFVTGNGTATSPADYAGTSGTLTFQAGETAKTFTVTTVADTQTEGSQSVSMTLSNPTNGLGLGAQSTATLWILDESQTRSPLTPGDYFLSAMADLLDTVAEESK